MNTADDYAAWIVKNADKKGTPDFATVAAAYRQAKAAEEPQAPAQDESAVSAPQAALIAGGGVLDRAAAGLRSAVPDSVRSALDSLNTKLGMGSLPSIDPNAQAANAAAVAPVADQHPVASFIGSAVPYLGMGPAGMGALAATEFGTPQERLQRGLTTFGLGKVGEIAGGKLADLFSKRSASSAADLAAQQATNAPRDATLAAAQNAGFVLPPDTSNPGLINGVLEGISGKIKTAQKASLQNQPVTNAMAASDIGLPAGEAITRQALADARAQAGQAYKVVSDFGTIKPDQQFNAAVSGIENSYNALTKSFKSLKSPDIETLISDLKSPEFDSNGVVEVVKRLRDEAFANKITGKPADLALGRIQDQAQKMLEGLVDRNLQAAGMPDAVRALQAARVQIAKTYSVQKALNDSTGDVVAGKLAQQLARGKPLSGNLQTIAQTAQAFPKAMQNMTSSVPPISPLDAGVAAISHGLKGLATVGARPLARSLLLSGPYQRAMVGPPSYAPGLLGKLMDNGGANPELLRQLGGLLGLAGPQVGQ